MPSFVKHVLCALPIALFLLTNSPNVSAQITSTRSFAGTEVRRASLEEFLINRLRATNEDQKAYIREIVKRVTDKKLELKLVLAMERVARRRSPFFLLPYFERSLRVEAAKRGVAVPTIKQVIATRSPLGQPTAARSDSRTVN